MTYNKQAKNMYSIDAPKYDISTFSTISNFDNGLNGNIGCDGQRKIQYSNEAKEGKVVPLSNAGAQPYAMMVESADAAITHITVNSSRWPENMTGVAEFNRSG